MSNRHRGVRRHAYPDPTFWGRGAGGGASGSAWSGGRSRSRGYGGGGSGGEWRLEEQEFPLLPQGARIIIIDH